MLRDAEGRPISLEGLSGISYRKGAEAPEPLDPEAPKPLKLKAPPRRGRFTNLEGLSAKAPDPGEPVSTPAPREEGAVGLHPLQKLEETPEKTDTEEDPYSVNEFLYDAGQTALFFGKLPAIKAGILWGVAEPSVQKYHFASALEEDDGYYAAARGRINRTLRTAIRRWQEKNPDIERDEAMWVLSHQENLNPAFSRYADEDRNLEGYARARLNDPKRPFMEWIKQGPGSPRAYVRAYRTMTEPYGELTREEMKGLREAQADLDGFVAPFLVNPFEQTLFEFKRSIREGANKGRGELLFNNFLELNQATWHLLKQIIATVPDKEYNQLIKQGDLPLTFMNWTGPIGDLIASGVGIGKNLGYGLRGMLKAFTDDPMGMTKARPMDAAMIAYMAFTLAKGSKNPALLKKLAEASPEASALMGIAKGAAEKRGLFKEATLGGKPFLKYQRQILAGLASLHKGKKPLKAPDFKIKEKLLEKRTYADVYASMLSAVTHGMIAGVPDIGFVVGLLKNMHSRGLNNAGWESFSRFMSVNFLNYYRQLTPEQEAIARRIARDAVEGGQSVKEVVSKLENYIRESDAVQEGGRETQTKKQTPASPTEATVDIETGQITKTKDLYEETLERAAERAARPEGVDVNDFVQREVDGVLKFERPMRVTQVVKSDKGIFVKVEGSEGYFPIKEVIRAEPPEGAAVPPMQTGARKTKAQEATEAEVAPEPLAPEQIERIAPDTPRAATFKEDALEFAKEIKNEAGEGIPNVEAYVALEQKVRSQEKSESALTKDPVTGKEFTGTGLMDQVQKEGHPRMGQEFQERRGYTKEQIADHEKLMGLSQDLMREGFDVADLQYLSNLKTKKIAPEVEAVPSEGKVQVRLDSDGRMIAVPDLEGMTLPELRRYATENKVPGRSRKKKAPLLELIKKFLSEEKGTVRALDAAAVGLVDALIKGVEGVTGQMEVLVRRYTQESNPLVRDAIAAKLSDLTESAMRANVPRSEIDEAIERGGVVAVEGGGYTVRGDAAERAYQRVLKEDVESLGVLSEASPRSLFEGLNDNQRRRLARRGIDTDADFANLSSSDQRRIAVDELVIERNRLQRDHVIDLLKQDGIIGKKAHRSHPTLEAELSESGGIIPKGQGASKGILAQRLATKGITPKDQRIPGDPTAVTAPTEKIPTRYYESPGAPKLTRAEREQVGKDFDVKPTPVARSAATPRATIGTGRPAPKIVPSRGKLNPDAVPPAARRKYFKKDSAKMRSAELFIGKGAKGSSTEAYREAFGDRSNVGEYASSDTVFVSVNGNRPGRIKFDKAEMDKALNAGVTIVADKPNDRARSFNIGEREVAKHLEQRGYREVEPGIWKPTKTDPKKFRSEIDSPNRIRDSERIAKEHPALTERGRDDVVIYSAKTGEVLARGYDRVVYGDHGPYIEFSRNQIKWDSFPKKKVKSEAAWYDEYRTADGSIMLYDQKKTVESLATPPATGKYSTAIGRPKGYADYKVGKLYLDPDKLTVTGPTRIKVPGTKPPFTRRPKKRVVRSKWITKDKMDAAPANTVFLFGDNLEGKGLGGQAKVMRGHPKAVGIPTKKKPKTTEDSYFTDAEFEANAKAITTAFAKIPKDATVVIPSAGLGTGLAQLQARAPRTLEFINNKIRALEKKKPIVAKVRREGEVIRTSPESVKAHRKVMRDAANRDKAASRLAAQGLDMDGVIAAVKDLVADAKKKAPVKGAGPEAWGAYKEAAYIRMIEEAHEIHGAHNVYEALATRDYGLPGFQVPIPVKIKQAYARKLAETYGPNADIPFLRENLKDLLTEKEIATLDANAKEMGLSYLDISKPAKHLTDIQAESLAAEINRRASLDLSPKEMKPLAEEFKRDIPPASSANIVPGTPKAIEIKLEAVENSNLPPAKKKAARQELIKEETEMHLGGAAVEAGTRANGTNPTYDTSPQAVAFKVTMPEVVPGKKQGYKVWTLKVGGKPGMLISSMKNEIKDIVKKLGIVQDRGSGPRVFGALKALEDAAAFGWSVMASDRLRNAIARNAVDQVFSVAEMEKGPFSGNKMKYFRLLKEANDYLNQFQVPLIAPIELQGSTVAKIPGIIKLGNKNINLYKVALDTIAKEVTSPQIAKEISSDAVKVIGETIAAEAGRAGFYKGQFNFVLDYFFEKNLEDFRQKVDRKASPLGYGEVDWNRVISLLESLTNDNASMANKILEKRILDNRAIPSVLPGNVDAAGLVSFMLDASNRAPIIREFNKTFKERTGRSMTPAEARTIMKIVRAEVPRLKRHTLLGEDLRVGFSAIREGGKWKRTKGRADYQEAVVNSFSRAVDGAFKTADEVYWRNLPEAWRFKLDPGFNSSYGWVHQKFIKRGFFERMVLNSKGKMTVWNLPTQKGNYFSNIGLISLYLGNTPMDAMAQTIVTSVEAAKHERLRRTGAHKKEWESGPVKIDAVSKRFYDQLPTLEIKTSDLAVAELNRLKELDSMNEVFSDIGNPVLSTFGDYIKDFKLNWATKPASNWLRSLGVGARKSYSYGDASGKLALARSAFKSMDKEMSEMVGGDIYHLEQSMAATLEITKNKDGYHYHGKRRLSQQQLDRYMAVAAERQANRLIPNYLQDVGAIIPILRGNILTGPFSWFPTWSYKMTPLPGKKGILTAVFLDDTTYGPVSNPTAFMKHQGVRAARVLRQIAYQNSLKGIAGDVDIFNGQVNERGPGTFSLGETVVVDDDEYGYAWVSSARNMNALNPGMTALLMLLRSAGLASKTLWSALGLEAPEQTQKLNKAFTSGFLTVGKEEVAQLAGLGGNLIVENIMSMTGAKQFGYRAPRGVDYFNKLGAAVIGGTPAQLLDGLFAHAGTESPLFMLSRYQFASPYGDGDQGAAVPVSRMMVQRLFGGFRKVNLIQADIRFIKKFTARLQETVSQLEDHIKIMYRDGKGAEAKAVEHELMEVRDEISRQLEILEFRRARSAKYLNVGSFD